MLNQNKLRIGNGVDVHPLVQGRKLVLGGVEIEHNYGCDGHSDGDVLNPDDYSVVGTWDEDMCELIFTDDEERDAHQGRKESS